MGATPCSFGALPSGHLSHPEGLAITVGSQGVYLMFQSPQLAATESLCACPSVWCFCFLFLYVLGPEQQQQGRRQPL